MLGKVLKALIVGLCLAFVSLIASANRCDNEEAKLKLGEISWLTEDYPPFNYINGEGELVGIFTDSLALIYQTLGIELNIKKIRLLPWARLYHNLQLYPESAAFSMMKTPQREKLFKLIDLPFKTKTSIMVLKHRKDKLIGKEYADLSIAVVRKDIGQQLLIDKNINANLVETTSAFSMLQLLMLERVDAIAYSEEVAHFQSKRLNFNEKNLEPIYVLDNNAIPSYAFHNATHQCALELMKTAIDSLEKKGKFQPIWQKYTK